MENTVKLGPHADEPNELRAEISAILEEIGHLREQMSRDQVEIERSRARTREMLAHLSSAKRAA
jgi:hypothetical protein